MTTYSTQTQYNIYKVNNVEYKYKQTEIPTANTVTCAV